MEEGLHLIQEMLGVVLFCIGITVMVMEMNLIASFEHQTKIMMYQQHVLTVYDGWGGK